MEKKLLITVSSDISHMCGVRFAGSFFRNKSAVSATLLYISPQGDPMRTGLNPAGRKAARENQGKAQEMLDTARRKLCDFGFLADNVTTKLIFKQIGIAQDIIREARKGHYDAVILGRRGYLVFESLLSTSLTKRMLDLDLDFPVWVCKNPDENCRNVLLCVDGSDASMRVADHVGFMLADEDQHSVTLFHVDTGEGVNKEAIMSNAGELITSQAPDVRVESIVVSSAATAVGKRILKEAAEKNYAVVGVGRVGNRKGRFQEWLAGSKTTKLVESIKNSALWVSS